LKAKTLKCILNLWPPFWGAGIKVIEICDTFDYAKVVLKLRWYNRNYVKTHYGGSLFSMTDPFYMLLLLNKLGNQYIVWDKSAQIKYIKPGKTHVYAEFRLTEEHIELIKEKTLDGKSYCPQFSIRIFDQKNETVASVNKELYIAKKEKSN
jgi:Domain of unknown function (DUF4442)